MKSVIISVILLLVVLTGVTLNAFHTCKTVESLTSKVEMLDIHGEITEEDRQLINSLRSEWNRKKDIFTYLYDYREIENIELSLVRMENTISSDSLDEFHVYKGEFLYSLSRLEEISILSFKNIL